MKTNMNLTLNEALSLVDNGITRFRTINNNYVLEFN